MSELQNHWQLVLRLFDELADRVRLEMEQDGEFHHIKIRREDGPNLVFFEFVFQSETYPALLINMPCNIETHKTFDHITYFKSGDIGQMLQVFRDEDERAEVHNQLKQTEGYNCLPDGLTPPTKNIIKRKYLKTRLQKDRAHNIVAEVEREIENMKPTEDTVEIFEEVVPFEEWMVSHAQPDGISITLSDTAWPPESAVVLEHPEILFRKREVEEMESIISRRIFDAEQDRVADIIDNVATSISAATSSKPRDVPLKEQMVVVESSQRSAVDEADAADGSVASEYEEEVLEEGGGEAHEAISENGGGNSNMEEDEDEAWMREMEDEIDDII